MLKTQREPIAKWTNERGAGMMPSRPSQVDRLPECVLAVAQWPSALVKLCMRPPAIVLPLQVAQ